MKKTNLKGLKISLINHKASLPNHWDDSIIEMRQGDLDEIENNMCLLENKTRYLESTMGLLLIVLKDMHKDEPDLKRIFNGLHHYPFKSRVNDKHIADLINKFVK